MSCVCFNPHCEKHGQGSHGDWKTWKMKMVVEKSWNMKNWPTVMEYVFCCHHQEIRQRPKSLISDIFRKMSQMRNQKERWSWKIKKRSWKSHGKIFCQVCGNPDGINQGAHTGLTRHYFRFLT